MEDEELPRIELKLEIKRNSNGIITTDIWKDWNDLAKKHGWLKND